MRKIFWTQKAKNDLDRIFVYIAEDSLFYAEKIEEEIVDTVENLLDYPTMGKKYDDLPKKNIREVRVRQYRIFYEVTEEIIFILALYHSSQKQVI